MNWTSEQVLQMAPDPASAQAGKALAAPHKWVCLGTDQRAAWGECQGSGKDPYRAQIDLGEPAFRCTCPSRKFPCKHSLGLFLLLAQGQVPAGQAPPWTEEWLQSRQQRQEKTREKSQEPEAQQRREVSQARTAAAREEKVQAGVRELQRWVRDQLRQGLAGLQSRSYQEWDKVAARMVDAQAPGLARRVRQLADCRGDGWQSRLLERLGLLHLLLEGYQRLESLESATREDVRTALGWTINQTQLLEQPGLADTWLVLGQRQEEEDNLRVQRTWLWGLSCGRPALVLAFAVGSQLLDSSLVVGTQRKAELVFYPGAAPMRAVLKPGEQVERVQEFPGHADLTQALSAWGEAVRHNPWQERTALALREVLPALQGEQWRVWDARQGWLPFNGLNRRGWRLMALSGGQPIGLLAEWDGSELYPLSCWAQGRLHRL